MSAWLLDTGPLVAFFDRSDAYHKWAVRQWSQAPVPLPTADWSWSGPGKRPSYGLEI